MEEITAAAEREKERAQAAGGGFVSGEDDGVSMLTADEYITVSRTPPQYFRKFLIDSFFPSLCFLLPCSASLCISLSSYISRVTTHCYFLSSLRHPVASDPSAGSIHGGHALPAPPHLLCDCSDHLFLRFLLDPEYVRLHPVHTRNVCDLGGSHSMDLIQPDGPGPGADQCRHQSAQSAGHLVGCAVHDREESGCQQGVLGTYCHPPVPPFHYHHHAIILATCSLVDILGLELRLGVGFY